MECHVPWDYLSAGAAFNFKRCCNGTKPSYSFEARPAGSAPAVGIVARQYSSCVYSGPGQTYHQNLQIILDPAVLAAALPRLPYMWRGIWNDRARRGQSAAQRKPLRVIFLRVADAAAAAWSGQGFVVVSPAAVFVGLPPGGPALPAVFPMDPGRLASDTLSLLQYDTQQITTLGLPTLPPLPPPGGSFPPTAAGPAAAAGCAFNRPAMAWNYGGCGWDPAAPAFAATVPAAAAAAYVAVVSVTDNPIAVAQPSTCFGEAAAQVRVIRLEREGWGPTGGMSNIRVSNRRLYKPGLPQGGRRCRRQARGEPRVPESRASGTGPARISRRLLPGFRVGASTDLRRTPGAGPGAPLSESD